MKLTVKTLQGVAFPIEADAEDTVRRACASPRSCCGAGVAIAPTFGVQSRKDTARF